MPARPRSRATCCARSGVTGRIKSPTYALLEPYELPGLHASHLDFYRFDDPREWVDAGLREVFEQPGLKLVEWPDKAAGAAARGRSASVHHATHRRCARRGGARRDAARR